MIEIEGKVSNLSISILIDSRASLSYISSNLMEICKLGSNEFPKNRMVKLAKGIKRKTTSMVKDYKLLMDGLQIRPNLEIIPPT